jgi:tetratricopeptide (TPR) repeat protein
MLPVWFALSALLSAWVLASARRRRFDAAAVTLWTAGTLLFPLIILPLYLIVRSYKLRREKELEQGEAGNVYEDNADEESGNAARENVKPQRLLRRSLPLIYLSVMLGLGALYFYMDWRSPDAYHMRANQARVREQREQVIAEYRAALKLEDDAHTHNLLGKELQAAGRYEEALAELRTAERMGEADEELPLNVAQSLDELKRLDEAKTEYERFLKGPLCDEMPHDRRCVLARGRVDVLGQGKLP